MPDSDWSRRSFLRAAALTSGAAGLNAAQAAPRRGATGARKTQAFALSRVRLLAGPFEDARALDARYLLSLNVDRLLHGFRRNAGLPPRSTRYTGWESGDLCPGHTLGHYLSACSMMWASTGHTAFRRRVAFIVDELHACQQASGSGLVCAFADGDTQLRNVIAGRPVTGVPWYTMHKILVGLLDAHVHAGHPRALPVLTRLADWMVDATQGIGEQRFQDMLGVEFGGMNEAMADVHALTGDPRHLRLAERFNHRVLLDALAASRDTLDGLHSNTQIPKVIGFQRLADATGDERAGRAARYFWGTVVHRRSFATGGNGEAEHFFAPAEARKHLGSAKTMETCCTHNMLRLTRALFTEAPSADYADYYERALFNGILASQDPDSGMVTYFQALRPGYPKLYGTAERSFWCCTGTGMENFAKLGDSIYFHDADGLYVNLFVPSTLDWSEQRVRVRQTTRFPDEATTRLALEAGAPTRFTLRLRHPGWCGAMTVSLNGQPLATSREPGRYVEFDRTWQPGDVVDVVLPMQLHLQALPGAPDVAAVMYGPLVLAARMGTAGMTPGADLVASEFAYGWALQQDDVPLPTLALQGRTLDEVVRPAGAALNFRTATSGREIALAPFHRIHHERYSLYWNLA
ncbi:MAG: beta-L-arabinofuranosidase domain-containing protein [Roseateles sp.]|uniref:beta-L-arabinofuranosidase domain-containing protein n=1 Tax=Roseateles sp. TaxID=1971397 RepID=UPI004035CE7A